MALTSASTISNAYDQMQNNLRWHGDITKAQNLHEAILFLLGCRPQDIAAETGVSMKFADLRDQLNKLDDYIKKLSTTVNRSQFTRGHANLH